MMYKTFNEYIEANTKEAFQVIESMDNEEQKEELTNCIYWLIERLRESHSLSNQYCKEVKRRYGEEVHDSISLKATINQIRKELAEDFEKYRTIEANEVLHE